MVEDEWEFERGEILTNLTLLEDHATIFACPYCMEKHASKIIGYAEEISLGSTKPEDKMLSGLAEEARDWRRKIQGLKEEGHDHVHVGGNVESHATKEKHSFKCGSKNHKEAIVECIKDGYGEDDCEQRIPCK